MKLFIFLLEKRRAFLHLIFCSLYLIVLFVLNWQPGGMHPMKALALLITGGAGIGIAYIVRYIFIPGLRRGRWILSPALLFANFLLIGIAGYLIFHVFDNPLSNEVVDSSVEQPLGKYVRFYISWYVTAAKYGVAFFLWEEALFFALDNALSIYWPNHVRLPQPLSDTYRDERKAERVNQFAGHFLNNLMSRVYSGLMSKKRMKPKQVAHLVSLVDYGQWSYLRSVSTWTSLTQEIMAVRHFFAMEDGHGIRLRVSGNLFPIRIPSVLLLSIAKNMVKHGEDATEKGDALLDIRMEGTTLYITGENRSANKPRWQHNGGGHGLQHIRQLLQENFGDRATFHTGMKDGRFCLYLQIDHADKGSHE